MDLQFYDMDGNKVSSNDWAASIVQGMFKKTIDQLEQRAVDSVSGRVCLVHGGTAQLTFEVLGTQTEPSIEIHATACCDDFARQAMEIAYKSWSTD